LVSATASGPPRGGTLLGAPRGGRSLTCLDSHNGSGRIHEPPPSYYEDLAENLPELVRSGEVLIKDSTVRKRIFVLRENVIGFVAGVGVERVAFCTFTPKRPIYEAKDLREWDHAMNNGETYRANFLHWWRVYEQHKSKAWHKHALADVGRDIRTGFDFDLWRESKNYGSGRNDYPRNYALANRARAMCCAMDHPIREIWQAMAELQRNSETFGQNLIEPVASIAEAVGKYLAKYLAKTLIVGKVIDQEDRREYCRGRGLVNAQEVAENVQKQAKVRLYGCSRGQGAKRKVWSGFAWNSPGRREWRRKTQEFAAACGVTHYENLSAVLGPRWAYNYRQLISEWTGSEEDRRRVALVVSESAYRKMTGL